MALSLAGGCSSTPSRDSLSVKMMQSLQFTINEKPKDSLAIFKNNSSSQLAYHESTNIPSSVRQNKAVNSSSRMI